MWCLHNILLCFYCQILEYVHVNRTEYSTQLYGMSPCLVMNKCWLTCYVDCFIFWSAKCSVYQPDIGGKCCTSIQVITQKGSIHHHMLSVNHPCSKLVSKITVWTLIFMATFENTVHLYNDINFEKTYWSSLHTFLISEECQSCI